MEGPTILSLPCEIILMILDKSSYQDVGNFGRTCKKFNDLIKGCQPLWKKQYTLMVHPDVMLAKNGERDWYKEMTKYVTLKKYVISYVAAMPNKYYRSFSSGTSGVSKEDIKDFIPKALADKSSLGECIYILQEFIRKGKCYLNNNFLLKPYSLTNLYYAKTMLQFLMHMQLSFYWQLHNLNQPMCPLEVVNFFVQWVDPVNIHSLKEDYKKIKQLETLIKLDLEISHPDAVTEDETPQFTFTDDAIIASIANVIFKQKFIKLTSLTKLDTLDIAKVFERHSACMIALGAIYQNVAFQMGLECTLVAFPNHFMLDMLKRDAGGEFLTTRFKISLENGECYPKDRCPFTNTFFPDKRYNYCPTLLAKYIIAEFLSSMGELRDWYTTNVEYLLDLLNIDPEETPNMDLIRYVQENSQDDSAAYRYEPDFFNQHLFQLTDAQRSVLPAFLRNDKGLQAKRKNVLPKVRDSNVKYAVGMLCYHKQYNYICLIYRWDSTCFDTRFNPTEVRTLQFGIKQPFYYVIALDQSKRYVPQENLIVFDRPTRLYHLEDIIARDFSHFNGFAYVPNDVKAQEYPEDIAVSELFKCRYEMQNFNR